MSFRKYARVEHLATYNLAVPGWKKQAKARGVSHYAQADRTSIQAILDVVSERYLISSNPADYIFAAFRAVTQDEPNGNGDAFPREELLSWNRAEKKPVYRTFEFKPQHVNHQAEDIRMARGVIVDVHYNESDPDDCFVEVLIAVDTKKDPLLAQGIAEGVLREVSMGCDALRTECNVCDQISHSPADYCVHIKSQKMKMCKAPDGEMKLAFERCYEVTFQEISAVDDPADKKADLQEMLTVEQIPSTKIGNETAVLDLKARVKRLETVAHMEGSFQRAASLSGDGMQLQGAQTNTAMTGNPGIHALAKLSEHSHLSELYARHYENAFHNPREAIKNACKEAGVEEEAIRKAWAKKMAEEVPHANASSICASLNAQLQACGDMKKAIKRTAKDMDIDSDIVERCAEYMKQCNKMANYSVPAAAQTDKGVEHGKEASPEGQPKEARSESQGQKGVQVKVAGDEGKAESPASQKEGAEAPPIGTSLPGPKDAPAMGSGAPQELADKIAKSAELAAKKAQEAMDKEKKEKEAQFGEPVAPGAQSLMDKDQKALENSRHDPDKKGKQAQEMPAAGAPAAPAAAKADDGMAEQAQAADAPNEKSLGDMGVKTAEKPEDKDKKEEKKAGEMPPEIKEKMEEKKGEAKPEDKKEEKKEASAFPFAKHYADVTAKKAASGEVHVSRAGKLLFTVPASSKLAPVDALRMVAQVGLIGAMKKLAVQKTADAGVQEGATSDAKGAYGAAPQSTQEGSISDGKDSRKVNPASATAAGAVTDTKDKKEVKSIENSNVREQAVLDAKGGYETSANETIGAEHTDGKEKHTPKNVGADSVLSQRQVDMVLKGLDPRSAALVKERLAVLKKAEDESEEAKAKKAADEKEMKDKEAKKADDEKELEKKANLIATARLDKFKRGLKLAARRFALNLEPCHLKHSMGAVLANRHEASGFEGLDANLVIDCIERGFSMDAALETTVDHMIKRGMEIAAMPEDSLKAIEADAANLEPVQPEAAVMNGCDEGDMGKHALRRRASAGNLSAVRPSPSAEISVPTKDDLVRQAVGGGLWGSRFRR